MRRSEPTSLCSIGQPATQILRVFERTLSGTMSEALLIWPQRPDCIAIFHALSALNRMETCDSDGLVTLYFPWNRNTPATQRNLLIDRNFIYDATLPVLTRLLDTSESHPVFGYLMALHSLKFIPKRSKKDLRFMKALDADPGLIHPTLFEILPQVGIQRDSLHDYRAQFLRRLRRHTWIAEQNEYIEAAIDPLRTPFFLFGVHADALRLRDFRKAGLFSSRGGQRPDIVLVDLTYRARNRLGKDWRQPLTRFLGIVGESYGAESPPVLAVTDDVFVLQKLRWDVLNEYDKDRGARVAPRRPATSQIVLHPKPHVLDHETVVSSAASKITAEVYGSDVLSVVDLGLKLRQSFLNVGDSELASAVTAAITSIQNIVGLPGPARQFHDFLADHYDGYEKLYHGSRFDHLKPRGQIKSALQQGLGGVNQDKLSEFLKTFDKICENAATHNPGSMLFDQCILDLARKPKRSILVFSSEVLLGFAEWRIENDSALSYVRSSLGRKLVLIGRRDAIEELELDQQERKSYHRIVFFEPHAEDLLYMLTQPWVPEKVFVLANLALASSTLRRVRILLQINGIDPIRDRLLAIQEQLDRALSGRVVDIPDLDLAPPLPSLGTLDLTDAEAGTPGIEETRLITTSGNFQIKAFDGSEMALYDADALQAFSLKLAKDLKTGQRDLCVQPRLCKHGARETGFHRKRFGSAYSVPPHGRPIGKQAARQRYGV